MIEIIPAILPKSFEDLKQKMGLVAGIVPFVQIDVVDGIFVPNKTWPYTTQPDPDFAEILTEEKEFPFWEEIDFEVDMMVANPVESARAWITAGAKRLIVHIESVADPLAAVQEIRKMLPSADSVLYTELGVAINPDTQNEKLEDLFKVAEIDFVQFMGISKIGYQGQTFDERVFEKISTLRAAHPNVTISVDGSVNLETAPKLIKAGVARLAIGSAIFNHNNVEEAIEEFFQIADAE
jgi:ribulose-phosphate 3-epimerase